MTKKYSSLLAAPSVLSYLACLSWLVFPVFGQTSDDADPWRLANSQAQAAFKLGDLDAARTEWKKALDIAEKSNNIDPGVVDCLCGLSQVCEKQGDAFEAERLYELAMRNVEALVGRTSTKFADRMSGLAWMYLAHNKPDKAEDLFKSALAINESAYGDGDARLIPPLNDYARFLRKVGRASEAQSLEKRVSEIKSKLES